MNYWGVFSETKSYLLEGIKITETLVIDIIFLCETRTKEEALD